MSDLEQEITRIQDHPVWGFLLVRYDTRIGTGWDHPFAHNVFAGPGKDPVPGEPAFYELPSIYPVTVVPSRYSGSYEGGRWLAFPCYPDSLRELCPDWDASDVECAVFWGEVREEPTKWLVGLGEEPESAYYDLIARIKNAAGAP